MADTSPDVPLEEPTTDAPEPPRPLLTLRDGLPPVTDTEARLAEACAAIAAGTGPVAIDAERASGYRYSSRAYLIQLRREGSGTWLIDPIAFTTLAPLAAALEGTDWILHAATQDLPCLADVGLRPGSLFDTELAGRLLGYPRVGLATLVETVLGQRLKKEHSAVDWSRRPLPAPWLEYAALDVEVLVELRAALADQLEAAGKDEWARQEFEHLLDFEAVPRKDAWRRTSGMHRIRGRRGLGAVRALWETRDELAERRDVTPGRIIPDSAIVAAAQALPRSVEALSALPAFSGKGARRRITLWQSAIQRGLATPDAELPSVRGPRSDAPPPPRAWADRDPDAAARLAAAREVMAGLSAEHHVPVENLLQPDLLRRLCWAPPAELDAGSVATFLTEGGARPWQVALAAPRLADAFATEQ